MSTIPTTARCPTALAVSRSSKRLVVVKANDREGLNEKFGGVMKTVNTAVDGVTGLLPESVPRPTARLAVMAVGILLAFTILQKILSTVLTLAVLGAAGYFFLNTAGGGGTDTDGEDIVAGSSDDPLEKAKRIMDKYK